MKKTVAEQEVIDQARFADDGDEGGQGLGGLGDFLDHVEAGIRALVKEMLQAYAEDEFMRYIGARPYKNKGVRSSLEFLEFFTTIIDEKKGNPPHLNPLPKGRGG